MECENEHSTWCGGGGGASGGLSAPSPASSRRGDPHEDQEHLQRLSGQVSSLEQSLSELREQAGRLASLSPATLIQLDRVEARWGGADAKKSLSTSTFFKKAIVAYL